MRGPRPPTGVGRGGNRRASHAFFPASSSLGKPSLGTNRPLLPPAETLRFRGGRGDRSLAAMAGGTRDAPRTQNRVILWIHVLPRPAWGQPPLTHRPGIGPCPSRRLESTSRSLASLGLDCGTVNNTEAQAAQGGPLASRLRWDLFLCCGSQDSAYYRTYRRQLRPSSRHEPRHPPWQAGPRGPVPHLSPKGGLTHHSAHRHPHHFAPEGALSGLPAPSPVSSWSVRLNSRYSSA